MICRAPSYNPPSSLAMAISQWAHLAYLHDWYSYETYVRIQDTAYRLLGRKS